MDLNVLREFAVLAERLNYARAALELNMAQSTLSRHMNALEREVGTDLFTHTTRTALTYAGQILLEEAGALFTIEDRMRKRIDDARHSIQGKVRLEDYFFSRDIKNFMLTAARRYRALYPGVAFEFVSVNAGTSIEGHLANDQLDVGVLVHTGPERPTFAEGEDRVIPLWHEQSRMGLYLRTDNLVATDVHHGEVSLHVLRRLPLVLPLRPEYANFRPDMAALCATHGFEASFKLIEMASLEDLAMLTMDGCAQVVLESDLRDPATPFGIDPACAFYPIQEVCWATPYLLLPDNLSNPIVASFADFLRDLAEERMAPR